MKKHLSLLFVLFFICNFSLAQSDLSLKEAVLGQYAQFYPEHIFGFQWIDDEGSYAYLKKYQNLVVGNAEGDEEVILHIRDLNKSVDGRFTYFANLSWINKESFIVHQKQVIAKYNIKDKKGKKIKLPEQAENIKFDPHYKYVSYSIDNNLFYSSIDEFKGIPVTNLVDLNVVSGQEIARSEMGITEGVFWSPTSDKLAFYQKDETYVHDYPLLDIDKYPGSLNSIKYPMAGQKSERAKLGIYHLKLDTTFYVTAQHGQENYITNVSWTPDDQFLIFAEVARSQKHVWVHKYKYDGTFVKTLFEEQSDTWVEPERPAYFPSNESNDFVWVSERDGFDNLYAYSKEGKLQSKLTNNKFVLKDVVAAENGEVFFTATGKNPLNTMLYKVDGKGRQKLLTKEEGTHQAVVSPCNQYVFDQYSSIDIPNKAVIRSAKGKIIKELLVAQDKLASYGLSSADISHLVTSDDVKLYTRLIKPKDFDSSKKYPVLIYVYGGPHAQLVTNSWMAGASLWMHWLANQGYIVFTLDNRGSANRGVDFEHIIHRNLGELECKDQMKGVEYLKSLDFIDTNRIAIHGWSFGGYMTINMMLKAPESFNVGVAGGPVTDWKFYEVMYGERYMDTPQENKKGYEETSLLNRAADLEGDLLMIHGTSDPVVVMQHSLALIRKFVEHEIQVDFFPYPMHEHNVRGKDRYHLMEKVLNYIIDKNVR
ncbi:S9 family peptidase [Brumimicrobium salinarum]|uniref:S9 family peptidase n=1 Tax=Brumimicrobium salinarum TaxID=2058658 RepID=A0A2I0R2R8_9FLAO|nr:DPP IV N-terminal domain-containing protein [Brumimicrobium salinarum]PKR80878.1 S9 family peptidase [Brumimicrobium salinarum]